jgi:hypothetical protein
MAHGLTLSVLMLTLHLLSQIIGRFAKNDRYDNPQSRTVLQAYAEKTGKIHGSSSHTFLALVFLADEFECVTGDLLGPIHQDNRYRLVKLDRGGKGGLDLIRTVS